MNAVEMAIKMEQDAVDFYKKCAEVTSHPVGKKMFLSIAEDEQYHIACAMNVAKGQDFKPSASTPKQDMKNIFEQNKHAMMEKVAASTDELDALKIAMKMEKEGFEFYKKAAAGAATPAEKALFECLAKDEEEHFVIFQNTCSFLSDTSNWFMWENHTIYEGG
jgi:rubrerythrin